MWSEPGGPGRRNRLPPAALAAPPARAHTSNLLLVTPFTSLLMRPAGAAGARRCGERSAKARGPGQARELRGWEAAAGRRAGAGGAEKRPSTPAGPPPPPAAPAAAAAATCRRLALRSPQPQLQPKTKTLSTCQQRRSSLGSAARARSGVGRGEERSAARDHPSPTPAQPTALGPGAAGARGGARPLSPPRPAGPPQAGGAGKCPCVGVSFCLGGGASARALADPGERGKRDNRPQHRSPPIPSPPRAWRAPQPTQHSSFLSGSSPAPYVWSLLPQ